MIRTLTRRLCRWLTVPAAFACCAASAYAQAAQKGAKGAATQAAESGPFVGEFVLALCAVGLILWVVCAPSHKAT
jgi:hypothetical protein